MQSQARVGCGVGRYVFPFLSPLLRRGERSFFWGCGTQGGSFFAPWAGMNSSFQDFGLSLAASASWFDFWIEDEGRERGPSFARSYGGQALSYYAAVFNAAVGSMAA